MDQKVQKIDLVQTRAQQLERQQNGFLKPIGKRLSLNVFEWKYPQIDELIAFLNGLPFKTVLLCPLTIEEQVRSHTTFQNELCHIQSYDSSKEDDLMNAIDWTKINATKFEALLFIADGSNADDQHTVFMNEWKDKQ